jgi:hypothetical protein
MLSIPVKYKVSHYCVSFVAGMFAGFHNPDTRGENFTWEQFPENMGNLVKAQVFIIFARKPSNMAEVEEYSYTTAKGVAESLLHAAGYLKIEV